MSSSRGVFAVTPGMEFQMGNDRGLWQMKPVETSVKEMVWTRYLARAEYLLLCALALVLPLFETPKNLILFLLLFVWVAQRVVSRDFALGRPGIIEISLLFMLAAVLASTLVNWPLANGLRGFQHAAMQTLVFWLLYRGTYSEKQRLRIAAMVAMGVVIGLAWGVVERYQGYEEFLTLHSAGGVIESATYIGIALVVTFSIAWVRATASSAASDTRFAALSWTTVALMLIGVFFTGNRGAILAVLVAGILYALVIGRRSLWLGVLASMMLAATFTTMLPDWFYQSRWLGKIEAMMVNGRLTLASPDVQRLDHWRVGVARIMEGDALLLGIGPHNSISIDYSKMDFDPPLGPLPQQLLHVHNMFLTKLLEEGIVGLSAMLFFLGVVVARIVRDHRRGDWKNWQWMAATGALTVMLVSGQFGPRWHQEHALLVMMVLGCYFGSTRVRGERRLPG